MADTISTTEAAAAAAATPGQDEDVKMNDIGNTDIVQKYKVAAEIANDTLKLIMGAVAPGKLIAELCQLGDDTILSKAAKVYNKGNVEKGLAFPTCVSVNHCAGHFSPLSDDTAALAEGDLVKIDLGAHIDGYIAQAAETIVVGGSVSERAADVISAAYTGAEVALRLIKAGHTNNEVTAALAKVAAAYNCKPVEGVLSHQLKRHVIDGPKVIIGRIDSDNAVDEANFEHGEVFCMDVLMSTGDGATKELDTRTTVFRRNVDASYSLKMKASRTLLSEASKRFPVLPFPLRAVDDERKGRLGIMECVNHGLFTPFPVLYEKTGELVAQCKFTVLLMRSGSQKITHFALPANVKSSHSIVDAELVSLLAKSAAPKKKSKNNKKKSNAAAVPGGASAATDATGAGSVPTGAEDEDDAATE